MKSVFKKRKERRRKNRVCQDNRNIEKKLPVKIDGSGNITKLINQKGVVGSAETEMFGCKIEKDIPEYVRKFADWMELGEVIRVPIRRNDGLTGSGKPFKCHFNVAGLVKTIGGRMLRGFSVIQDSEDFTNCGFSNTNCQFVYHSVWINPEGNASCVSNNYEENNLGEIDRNNLELNRGYVLFIPIGLGLLEELLLNPEGATFDPYYENKFFMLSTEINSDKNNVRTVWCPEHENFLEGRYFGLIRKDKGYKCINLNRRRYWKEMIANGGFSKNSLATGKSWGEFKTLAKVA